MTFGSLNETSMSSRRPPMLAGPIDRKRKLASVGFEDSLKLASRGGAPRPCARSEAVTSGAARSGNERTGMARRNTLCMMSIRWEIQPATIGVGERLNMNAVRPRGESRARQPETANVVDAPCVQRARLRTRDRNDHARVEREPRSHEHR